MVAMAATRVGMGSPPMVTKAAMAAVVAMVEERLPTVLVLAVATGAVELLSREQVAAETLMREPYLSATSDLVLKSPRFPMCSEEIG